MDSGISSNLDRSARSGSAGPSMPYSFSDTKLEKDQKEGNGDKMKHEIMNRDVHKQESVIKVDVTSLQTMNFENVKDIREKVDQIFAPQNVKMIWKRAERVYANGYWVFVLYWNRWSKRKPSYKSHKRYKKRSTGCPFQLKFTKHEREKYRLTDGVYWHNHLLTTPVLDPQILRHLDHFDPTTAKPAFVKKFINQKFGKDISYAQIAYELTKRKKKICGQQTLINIGDIIKDWSAHMDSWIETDKDKSGAVTRLIFQQTQNYGKQSSDNRSSSDHRISKDRSNNIYTRYSDVLIIHKIDNMVLFIWIDGNANIVPVSFAAVTNTVTDDYMWVFCKFVTLNNSILPRVVIVDFDDSIAAACKAIFVKSKIIYSPWSIYQTAKDMMQETKNEKSSMIECIMKTIFQSDAKVFEDKISWLIQEYYRDPIARSFIESIRIQAKMVAFCYHKTHFTGGLFGTSKWFNVAKSKLANEVKNWFKVDKTQKNGAKRQSIYKIFTSNEYSDWVFADSQKITEQDFTLKQGSDKIKKFFTLNKHKYHPNVLQKLCREWLKSLDLEFIKSSKVEWEVRDMKNPNAEVFKVVKKDLAYRWSWYMNNHSGVPCSHIFWCMSESKSVEEIGRDIVVHRRFYQSSKLIKEEVDSKQKDKHQASIEDPKSLQHEILKFNKDIDNLNIWNQNMFDNKDPYEMLWTEPKNSRKRARVASNTKANKRHKTDHDQTDSLYVNIDPEEQNLNFMSPVSKDDKQARPGYSLKRKWTKKDNHAIMPAKETEEETYNSVKGEMEYNFNLGLDFNQHSKGSDDVILSNSDPTYRQEDEKSLSELFEGNNCFNSDWSSLFQE